MGVVRVGVDIGQKHDPTAICVIEEEWRDEPGDRRAAYYLARRLERLPLGTPYPAVATRLHQLVAGLWEWGLDPAVYVDATGVGQPVVDLLAAKGLAVTAVYFTHGDRRSVSEDGRSISLGKAFLVSRLQTLLQGGHLLLPRTAEATTLAKELQDYEIHVDEDANDTYGAFAVGTHDDLVTALGLAIQGETRLLPPVLPSVVATGGWSKGAPKAIRARPRPWAQPRSSGD